jgi:DHA2 family multidrug resistance protein-like MFS transporter
MELHQATAARKAGRREWVALCVLLLPLLLVSMDVSVLYFAVPFISRDLAPTSTEQLWIFDIYGFVLAGLLLTMGVLGDRIGRRRLLTLGATAFGLASAAAAYAPSAGMLILARALLGIGGATLMPSTLGLIRNMFHDDKQRGTAVAIWSAAVTGGVALGPVLSGLLLDHFWWGSVFLVNPPAMVMLLVLAPILVPEFRDPNPGRFDLAGSALSLGAVLPVIYGLKKIAADGPGVFPVLSLIAGLALGAVFVRRQRTRPDPMIDLRLFRRRAFSGSIVTNLVAAFAMMGSAIFTTQYLQSVLGLSPLTAALWSVVPSVGVAVAAPVASALAQRTDRAYVISGGFVVAALGFAGLSQIRSDSRLWAVLTAAGVLACGIVTVMTLVTDMVLGAVPPERAGSASALAECATEFGGAFGMAVLGSVGTAVYRHEIGGSMPAGLPPGTLATARETLGGATVMAGRLPGQTGDAVLHAARQAFTDGMNAAAIAAAVIMGGAAVLAAVLLRRAAAPVPAGQPGTAQGGSGLESAAGG